MKMKKLCIIVGSLVALTSVAHAAEIYNKDGNKVDLYGRVYALNYINNGGDSKAQNPNLDGDKTTIRIGINGQTQISDFLTGYGRFEYERGVGNVVNGDVSSNGDIDIAKDEMRYAYAGFRLGNYGSVDYGRNDGVAKSVMAYAAIAPEFGGDSKVADMYMTERTNSVLTYRNNDFFGVVKGLNVALQYQDSNGRNERDRNGKVINGTGNGDGWGTSAEYSILDTGVTLGVTYTNSLTNQLGSPNKHAEITALGAKYQKNNLYLAAMYSQSNNMMTNLNNDSLADKARTYELAASYGFDLTNGSRITPEISYLLGKDRTEGLEGPNRDMFKYVDLGVTYDFNKNMSAIADYQLNMLKNGKKDSSKRVGDTLALGLIYNF